MKDEEMAEEYIDRTRIVDENTRVGTDCISLVQDYEGNYIDIHERIKQAFLAGLKVGRLQWHDLRKDKKDLPKKEGKNKFKSKLVYISYPDGDTDFAYYDFPNKEWYRLFNDEPTISPIAWCEIPTFEKE